MTSRLNLSKKSASRLLAAIALAGSQITYAFEACIPPECKAPVALEEFANYGNTPLDKLLMALSLVCAWLIVWGFFFMLGRKPRRKAPITLLDPVAIKFHEQMQDEEQKTWQAIRSNPDARSALRRRGAAMVATGLAFACLMFQYDNRESLDLAGSTARIERWTGDAFAVEKELRLLDHGKACVARDGGCAAWGTWHASANTLTLIPIARDENLLRLYADESATRYWAKPTKGDELALGAFLELPKNATVDNGFTHASINSPLAN